MSLTSFTETQFYILNDLAQRFSTWGTCKDHGVQKMSNFTNFFLFWGTQLPEG